MKKLALVLMFAPLCVYAQTGVLQGHCYLGGKQATTSGMNSSNYLNGIIPACTVTVYLTGTLTKQTITKPDGSALANPFTANTASAVDPGGWIFRAATNQGLDVVLSGGNSNPSCITAPLCYTQPVTLTDVFPTQSFSPVINPLTIQTNGTGNTSQSLLNFTNSPTVTFSNPSGGVETASAQIAGGLLMQVNPPAPGQQQLILYPTSSSGTGFAQNTVACGGSSPGTSCSGSAALANGGSLAHPYCSSGCTSNPTITWTFTAPSYLPATGLTVYGGNVSYSYTTTAIGNMGVSAMTCGIGGSQTNVSVYNVGSAPPPLQTYTAALSGVTTPSQVSTVTCTASINETDPVQAGAYGNFPSVFLVINYTGTAPPANTAITVIPPLNFNPGPNSLSLVVPFDVGIDTGSANAYAVSLPWVTQAPGTTVKFVPAHASTSTTPTFNLNTIGQATIVGPQGGALQSGDLNTTATAIVVLDNAGNWRLQDPQVSNSSIPYPGAGVPLSTGSAWGTSYTAPTGNLVGTGQSNTWTTGTQDFSGVSQLKSPVAAGYTSAANGECGYDSTNKNWHCWVNGADSLMVPLASGFVSGHCAQPTNTGGSWSLVDVGGACGVSGGGSAFSAITSGTNTTAAMIIGSGGSLAPTGTGTIQATSIAGTISSGSGIGVTGSGTTASPYVVSSSGSSTGGGLLPSYGSLVNQSNWTSLANYSANGVTPTVSGGALQFTGGAGTFTQSLDWVSGSGTYTTTLPYWTMSLTFTVGTKGSTTYGVGPGIRSTESLGTLYNFAALLDVSTGANAGKLTIYGPSSTVLVASSATFVCSAGDSVKIILTRNGYAVYASAVNLTTAGTGATASYLFSFASGTTNFMPNAGHFAIYNYGGTQTVTAFSVSSMAPTGAQIAFVGDSKMAGYFQGAGTGYGQINAFAYQYPNTVNFSGGGDSTTDVLNNQAEIIAHKPLSVVLSIGRNDVCNGVSLPTAEANYTSIVNAFGAASPAIPVYNLLLWETNCANSNTFNAWVKSTYPSTTIDPYLQGFGSSLVLNADGIHPNITGAQRINQSITAYMQGVAGLNLFGYYPPWLVLPPNF